MYSKSTHLFRFAALFIALGSVFQVNSGQAQVVKPDYLRIVQEYADTLLAHATDRYGSRPSRLWASVIDSRDLSVPLPSENVEPTQGTRIHDRAVWGSNFYHDVANIRVMRALTKLTGNPKYREASDAYIEDFLKLTQNPQTGILGWGEHLSYDFYGDSVTVGDGSYIRRPYGGLFHEFLGETPPWEWFWEADSARTRRAIEGLRYHFRGFQTQSYLFNRHAAWNVVHPEESNWQAYQFQRDGQPWIKHSGLLAYSFAFLYDKTGRKEWLEWAKGVGELYWSHRNPETNLTVACIDDQRPSTRLSSLNQTALLAYWLLKSSKETTRLLSFREEAEIMLKAAERVSWYPDCACYRSAFEVNGTLANPEPIPVFTTGYGNSSIMTFGRVAVYFAQTLRQPEYVEMARRCAGLVRRAELPADYVINSLAEAVNFWMDMYDLTGDEESLREAARYADRAIADLRRNGLFARQPGDPYYEAKLGTGELVQGLLRIHLAGNSGPQIDWSF